MGQETDRNPTLLYVDDQPSHLALFRKAFEGDYSIMTASSGLEGIEIIKNNEIFLAIADHNMPHMSGIDFLQKVQEIAPKVEQALLSAYTDESLVKEATARTKISEYLRKPWKREMMKGFIEESLRKYKIEIPGDSSVDPLIENPPVAGYQIVPFLKNLKETVTRAGARRIFLSHVEPPLKRFVPTIRRPVPELLGQAQREAIKGDVEGFQKRLVQYFRSCSKPA